MDNSFKYVEKIKIFSLKRLEDYELSEEFIILKTYEMDKFKKLLHRTLQKDTNKVQEMDTSNKLYTSIINDKQNYLTQQQLTSNTITIPTYTKIITSIN